ncbi:MAG: hypothetical protein L0I76_33910 [Pseudonocardia sp.]|nr:hypothetical protein [Pseudonocardia sp.]MDN5920042.1 hypothetical protein [Pseudonocardia sp.]MDN5931182.1 hypothetical protein [Pseudonocardia sp.]
MNATVTDAKTIAADIRKAVRAATRTEGDALHGLTISVRYRTASRMEAIGITVKGLGDDILFTERGPDVYGSRRGWSQRARAISDRLHELAAPGFEWETGRHSFCDIDFDGTCAPAPR